MATESIFHNFLITGVKPVKRFVAALEKSAEMTSVRKRRKNTLVNEPAQIRSFFDRKKG